MAASQILIRTVSSALLVIALGISCSNDDPIRPPSPPASGLTWMPLVTAEPLRGIWGTEDGTLLGVGPEGGFLRLVGDTWEFEPSGSAAQFEAVWGANPSDVYAVGHRPGSSSIVHYDGETWTEVLSRPGFAMADVWGVSGTDVFAVGHDTNITSGHIEHYDGSSWTGVSASKPLRGVWGTSTSDVFAVGEGPILHFDGDTWSPMTTPVLEGLHDIWGASPTNVFAVGSASAGVILHYDGVSWSEMPIPATEFLVAVWGADSTDVFALGGEGTLLHYDGATWVIRTGALTDVFFSDLWGRSSTELYATTQTVRKVGPEPVGSIYRHDGTGWTSVHSPPTTEVLYGVAGFSSNVFAVGLGGAILRGTGTGWETMNSGTTETLNAAWVAPDGIAFAGGRGLAGPTILRFDGSEWSSMSTDLTGLASVEGMWGTSSANVYAVGWTSDAPSLLHYEGAYWSSLDLPPEFTPYAVWGSSPEDVFVVGNSSTILHFNGAIWTRMKSGTTSSLRTVWGSSSRDVYAAGGTLVHYDGVQWRPVDHGLGSGWNDPLSPVRGIWGSSSKDVFIVSERGTIAHFDGWAWSLMESKTSQQLLGVWGRAADDVFAVGWNGRVQHYGAH